MQSHEFPQGYFGTKKTDHTDEQQKASLRNIQNYKKRYIVNFIKTLPPNATVLDSGCGKGKTIRMMIYLRPDITIKGHDITDLKSFLPEGIEFTKCTTEDLTKFYAPNSFDAVLCQHVFEHLIYPNQAMENFIKILKPGGRVLIETPNWTRLFIPFSRLYFWNDYTHIHPFCKRAFERMFSEYGMNIERIATASSVDYSTLFRSLIKGSKVNAFESSNDTENSAKTKIRKTRFRKYLDWGIEFFVNPFTKDILIGIAKKP